MTDLHTIKSSPFSFYLDHGFTPIPVIAGGKKPVIKWQKYQTTQPAATQCQHWDDCQHNIGLVTGKAKGFFVVDVDGADGQNTLDAWQQAYGTLPETLTANTARGLHLYFRYPEGRTISNSASKSKSGIAAKGIDIRGNGGFIIAPPSIHPTGKAYAWQQSPTWEAIAHAPDWLLDIFTPPEPTPPLPMASSGSYSRQYLQTAMQDELAELARTGQGSRNDQLNKSAYALGQLVCHGLDESEATQKLYGIATAIGLEPEEATKTIKSGLNDGKTNPRTLAANSDNSANSPEWHSPDLSLIQGKQLPPPEFPLDVFPSHWADWLKTAAICKNAPVDYVATAFLAGIAGMAGNSFSFSPWDGWQEPCILWAAIVGNPSSGKSPALDAITSPMQKLQHKTSIANQELLKEYRQKQVIQAEHEKAWKKACQKALRNNEEAPEIPKEAQEIYPPRLKSFVLHDVTIEKAAEILARNQRGITIIRDELSGLIANFERRGGDDRQFYLEAYGGCPYSIQRVKYPDGFYVPMLAISLIGGVQPDKLNKLILSGDEDGFSARFLYTWPAAKAFHKPNDRMDMEMIEAAFKRLSYLEPCYDHDQKTTYPRTIRFSDEAESPLIDWLENQCQLEANRQGFMLHYIGKTRGQIVRLSGVLTLIDWLQTPVACLAPAQIEADAVERAIRLVRDYFLPMAERCTGDATLPEDQRDAKAIAEWLLKHKPRKINARAASRLSGFPVRKDSRRIDAAFDVLSNANWLAYAGERQGDSKGRAKKDFSVNPAIMRL